MKNLGNSKSIKLRFFHGIVSGLVTGLVGWWSLSRLVERVLEINFHLGMTLKWTSVSLVGIGLLSGFLVSLLLSIFDGD
jgi:hypothetical protein